MGEMAPATQNLKWNVHARQIAYSDYCATEHVLICKKAVQTKAMGWTAR